MLQIDRAFESQILSHPDALFQIILRVEGDMDARAAQLAEDGLQITRRMWLVNGFAGTASGAIIHALESYDWIVSIEPDIEMRTMDAGIVE